jgi:adenylate cyclase
MALLRPPKVVLRKRRPTGQGMFAHWTYLVTVMAAIAVVVLVGLVKAQFLPDLSNQVFDWYQRFDHREWDPKSPVRIADIDDESLARHGQWPWPRSTVGETIKRLGELGAVVVAIDILLSEPDRLGPEHDAKMAQAMTGTPTVLGAILKNDGAPVEFPTRFGIATAGDNPMPFLAHFSSAVVPLPILSAASAGVGALNWLPDRDQVVRRVPLVMALGNKAVPGLSIEALRLWQGTSTVVVRSSNASGQSAFGAHTGVNAIKVGDFQIPTDPQGEMRVRYTRSDPRRFIPAWKLLAGEVDRGDIEGRIILIGSRSRAARSTRDAGRQLCGGCRDPFPGDRADHQRDLVDPAGLGDRRRARAGSRARARLRGGPAAHHGPVRSRRGGGRHRPGGLGESA